VTTLAMLSLPRQRREEVYVSVPRHLRAVDPNEPHVSRAAPDLNSAQRLEDLLCAAGRGSAAAFEAVYVALLPVVYRLALRVVRDENLAEDVAQEALVEAWRKAASFDPTKGTAKAWVLTIAHRRAVDKVRREQRQRDQVDAESLTTPTVVEGPADSVIEADFTDWQRGRVRAGLAQLSEKQREVIELAYYRGRKHTEISEELGVPLGTAKTRIRDALIKLRDAMEEV